MKVLGVVLFLAIYAISINGAVSKKKTTSNKVKTTPRHASKHIFDDSLEEKMKHTENLSEDNDLNDYTKTYSQMDDETRSFMERKNSMYGNNNAKSWYDFTHDESTSGFFDSKECVQNVIEDDMHRWLGLEGLMQAELNDLKIYIGDVISKVSDIPQVIASAESLVTFVERMPNFRIADVKKHIISSKQSLKEKLKNCQSWLGKALH